MTRLYLMLSATKPWRVKIGISTNVRKRSEQVGASPIFHAPFVAAGAVEKMLHGIFKPLNSRERKESGSTEWFWILNIMSAIAVFVASDMPYAALAVLLAPIPFDVLIAALAVWLFQVGVVVGFVYLLCHNSIIFP